MTSAPPAPRRFTIRGLLLLAGLACGDPPPEAPAAPPAETTWTLAARHSPQQSDLPQPLPYPAGAELLDPACRAEPPPAFPCAVERWTSKGGGERVLVRTGERLREVGTPEPALQGTWRSLGWPLADCLGDPLAVPPAGDPHGIRLLREDGRGPWWVVVLGGGGRCGLSGTLRLDARQDRVDPSDLRVARVPWADGGAAQAAAALRAEVRVRVREGWDQLDAGARILALESLSRDPDPEAEGVLRHLLASDPGAGPDITQALDRWRQRHGAPER